MNNDIASLALLWIIWVLLIFAYAVGIDKMIKIIVWNYLLWTICLSLWLSIDLLVKYSKLLNDVASPIGLTYWSMWNFLFASKATVIVITYLILLIIVFSKSKLNIELPNDENAKIWLKILLIPITVFSVILTLQIAILGATSSSITDTQQLSSLIWSNIYIARFIEYTPFWMLIHWIITIALTSEINFSRRSHWSSHDWE